MECSAFGQKGVNCFWQSVDTTLKMFPSLKQLFDAKMIIKRLSSFSVPKFTVIRQI